MRATRLFAYAVNNLNRLEDSGSGEMRPQIEGRLQKLAQQDPGAWDPKTDWLAMTLPQPDMLREVVNRLNQWITTQPPPADWRLDPLVAQLPPSLRELPQLQDAAAMEFSFYDGFTLEEAVWLRNLSDWARGNTLDDLQRVRKLFDWTVRNIQRDLDAVDRTPLLPREVLLLGHGTAMERAWVFVLLARQQGLDAAVLAFDTGAAARKPAAEKKGAGGAAPASVPLVDLEPWFVAVMVEGKLYLFDPALGLPIPAPGPIGVDGSGQLDIRPATLAQVIADEGLLRRLNLSPKAPYLFKAADLKHLVLLVEGAPQSLAKRMKLLESHLTGKQKLVLTTTPSAQAERLKQAAGPRVRAQLWTLPYETLECQRRLHPQGILHQLGALLPFYATPSAPLYRGRVLHLKGRIEGEDGATACYQNARPSDDDINGDFQAEGLKNQKLPPQAQAGAADEANLTAFMRRLAKHDAGYWLGLIAFEQENYPSAIDYFTKRTLGAFPNSHWQVAAAYNVARAYEASGQRKQAIAWYTRFDRFSPALYGNILRARWLEAEGGRKAEGEERKSPRRQPGDGSRAKGEGGGRKAEDKKAAGGTPK